MIDALLALTEGAGPLVISFLTVFLRVGGIMLLLPGLGDRLIPTRVRLVAGFSLAVAITPTVTTPTTIPFQMILTEGLIGLAFGAVLRFLAQALLMAGMMAAQLTSLSQLFGTTEPSSAIGNVLNLAGLCLLMATGLPLYVIDLLVRSYDILPIGAIMPGSDVASWGVGRLSHAFALAFALAAPFALVAILYNMALGVINRAMPQLMVALVGAPAITGLTGVILMLAAPVILSTWHTAMVALLVDPISGGVP
ncbi:flagellar biosynthesis protein FliR [Jannaschia pagri]|uniref:Flagellar biosynthesis protein FliR n=1 Tax=Jannaschia pagri TaxID=2829797 RepID=A0ABQ4NM35_9RHOB|nr:MULTISPECIES: flagellar biosynthetic protein FliR [unclassified Jannaschia]GIT91631.1 flagellar biosynthesis protein FliR [Jannaschia sp. AI_61]GIT95465.1 flagellar biosynthesis protein FliR [Jannaschia sp. AI_62]